MRTISPDATSAVEDRVRTGLQELAHDEAPGVSRALVVRTPDMVGEICERTTEADLVILGLRKGSRSRKLFGPTVLEIVGRTSAPLIMISQRD